MKLTMAAIAKELNRRELTEAAVYLAVGLPLTWVGQQKDSFIRYLTQVRNLEYTFNGKDYDVEIVGVEMFAQGFAAVADRLKEFIGEKLRSGSGSYTVAIVDALTKEAALGSGLPDADALKAIVRQAVAVALQELPMQPISASAENSGKDEITDEDFGVADDFMSALGC